MSETVCFRVLTAKGEDTAPGDWFLTLADAKDAIAEWEVEFPEDMPYRIERAVWVEVTE